ncbi:hypothetical protein HGG63_07735 [Alteromonadaceae bacterium A_SAG1]|nr:hypothetical protein [Alteromonadaceae bacterium A_SAG1]
MVNKTKIENTAIEKAINNLEDSIAKLVTVQGKNDHVYRYPSQTQYNSLIEWGIQFRNESKFMAAQHDPDFQSHWNLSIKSQAYNLGKFPALYNSFIWVKANVVQKMSLSIINALASQNDILLAITTGRSLLEQIGSLALAERSICTFFETIQPDSKEEDWLFGFEDEIRKWTHGTRINWEDYYKKGLRDGSRGSFDSNKGHFGVEARGLMQGVDLLAKKVKGARKAYEFASEFVHPNHGSFAISVSEYEYTKQDDGLILWLRMYSSNHSLAGQKNLESLLAEYFEICAEAIQQSVQFLIALKSHNSTIKVQSRKSVKQILKAQPEAFVQDDLCPCFSGKILRNCCKLKRRRYH